MDSNSLYFDRLNNTPGAVEDIAGSVAAGEPLWLIAQRYDLTQGKLGYWLTIDADRALLYAGALKSKSHDLLHEGLRDLSDAVSISDEQMEVERDGGGKYDPNVQRDGLRTKTRLAAAKLRIEVAGLLNPERYGKQADIGGAVVGALTVVLREISERKAQERRLGMSIGNGGGEIVVGSGRVGDGV
jgi:hypothetical protein